MKIVLAPDSFKGSLRAAEVCASMAAGVRRAWPPGRPGPEILSRPLADGGEGTTEALVAALGGTTRTVEVTGPLRDQRVTASWALLRDGETAVVELASASGLPLVPPARRNPLHTSSYGTGELIAAALAAGARRLVVGVGGSATIDLGAGIAQALGARFTDASGAVIDDPLTGARLADVAAVDLAGLAPKLAGCRIEVARDVDNPLLGPAGAAAVYGPQKGATPEDVARLERNLKKSADIVESATARAVRESPGAGAAGGAGFGLCAFLGARLRSGVDLVMEARELAGALRGARLCLTGEGRLDGQTSRGKVISGVARLAAGEGVPVVAIVGALEPPLDPLWAAGLTSAFSLCPGPTTLEEALVHAAAWTADVTERALRLALATGVG